MPRFVNLDDGETMFFERELEARKRQSYDVLKSPMRGMQLVPVVSEAGAGAESIVYEQYDMTGMAKIIANYADDLPRADVKGKEFVAKVKSVGDSYGYSIQEIRAAQMAGKPLEQRKANAAVYAQQTEWNRILFFGDAVHGLPGWLTNPNIPLAPVAADGAGGGGNQTEWVNKTPNQIIRDMNAVANGIVDLTGSAERPNTLVLPIEQHSYIASTPRSDNSDTTILDFFLRNNPFITAVEWCNEIKASERAKYLASDPFTGEIMIAYNRSPDKLTFEMPQMFEQFPVQERNLEYVVPCHSRVAGTLIYYPLSMSIAEGI